MSAASVEMLRMHLLRQFTMWQKPLIIKFPEKPRAFRFGGGGAEAGGGGGGGGVGGGTGGRQNMKRNEINVALDGAR